jgi:hypothetical protein
MRDIKLTIQINKPLSEVFAFTINPKNTPSYVDSIIVEETSEWPVKKGATYRNKRENSEWSEYEVTEFKENEIFELRKKNDDTIVRYTFKPINNKITELEYYVQTKAGGLEEASIRNIVEKLKIVLEK